MMASVFIGIYRFFRTHRPAFWLFLVVIAGGIIFFASRIHLEEDISRLTAKNDSLSRDEYVIRNVKFAEKIIVYVSHEDTLLPPSPDSLIRVACMIRDSLTARLDTTCIRRFFLRAEDTLVISLQKLVVNHLPLFLDEADYRAIDSLTQPAILETVIKNDFRILVSPASMALKKQILRDPLGMTGMAMKKLQSLQAGEKYDLIDGYVFTRDRRHLLMFITPANPPSETKKNARLVSEIDHVVSEARSISPGKIHAGYFGAAAVAAGNADQLKQDIVITLTIALVLIVLLTGWYFRSMIIPLLGFVPAFFGGGLSLALLSIIKGNVSAIALGIGSVILGLIIDYSLYIINHYRKKRSIEVVIRDMAETILICSLTSIGAFLCLTFLDSAVLHDLGWFAAISIFGAALFALIILPQFLGNRLLPDPAREKKETFIDRFAAIDFGRNPWLTVGLLIIAAGSFFFLHRVAFEKDMNVLNYMPESLLQAQAEIDRISGESLKKVYIVSTGKDIDEALRSNERVVKQLGEMSKTGLIDGFSGITAMMLSDSAQQRKIAQWNSFFTGNRIEEMTAGIQDAGKKTGFRETAFDPFTALLNTSFTPGILSQCLIQEIFDDWIHVTSEMVLVTAIANVPEEKKANVYQAFTGNPDVALFDRQNLTQRFVSGVKHDFDRLVMLSMIFVSLLLLISFGRIEPALITALPMFMSWLITLGFMGISGIRFNIFNIIISSFIFGLGVDYSILMMRGLLQQYKTGERDLQTYQVSIFLSSLTTLFGVGALFFARHPALNSIALVSIAGITAVVLISYGYQSMLARWLLLRPLSRRSFPVTAGVFWKSVFIAWIPITTIAVILVVYGLLISPLLPVPKHRKQTLFHRIFCRLSRIYITMNFPRYHAVENPGGENFNKPAIIISNHQSLIETPALLRLHPNILILTNEWVYRHWVFGPVAKLAGFPPMAEGIDNSLELLRRKLDEGYSILIFPEGHRSPDGHIQRFHRGAFYIAEKLRVDILPILIFGSGDFLRRGEFWGRPNRLFMKILPRITPENTRLGSNYSHRAKLVRRYYREEYAAFRDQHGTPSYYRNAVRLAYLFKGPVLEWYVRIKMMLEKDFILYHKLLPKSGIIIDFGCGYGYITYMLMLTSPARHLTGVDFDEEKIEVARNTYLKNDRISFLHADVSTVDITSCNGFLLGDVLHYLPPEAQQRLLEGCMENLQPGGVILIREGNTDMEKRHKRTRLTEFFSTRIINFNRTSDFSRQLWFISAGTIRNLAHANGFEFEMIDRGSRTSNVFMVIRRTVSLIT
jgi:1-acyl-sn-glycerol-3-phosphate acyltransferase